MFARHQGVKAADPPRHPDFDNPKVLAQLESAQLVLDFPNPRERKEFTLHLNKALSDRNKAEIEYRKAIQRSALQEGRPNRSISASTTRANSIAFGFGTSASAPSLAGRVPQTPATTLPGTPLLPNPPEFAFRRSC